MGHVYRCSKDDAAAASRHPLVAAHLAYRRERICWAARAVLTWLAVAALLWVLAYG